MSEKQNRHRIAPQQTERARKLRREATYPERLLWQRLRRANQKSVRFRRQVPIGPFIADFFCPEANLVVELDGVSHDERAVQDAERTTYLSSLGLEVFRVTNDEVVADSDAVAEAVSSFAKSRAQSRERLYPPPAPP
ncbi:MAG: endonuclease domain-containing protein [Planctomycetes bacterium]|nr:endonuclease domain-containing protein [Planctomycetota bacterium]